MYDNWFSSEVCTGACYNFFLSLDWVVSRGKTNIVANPSEVWRPVQLLIVEVLHVWGFSLIVIIIYLMKKVYVVSSKAKCYILVVYKPTIYCFPKLTKGVLLFDATFNNISVISWQSVLFVEETGENRQPAISHWQTISHNVVHLVLSRSRTHNIGGDRHRLHM